MTVEALVNLCEGKETGTQTAWKVIATRKVEYQQHEKPLKNYRAEGAELEVQIRCSVLRHVPGEERSQAHAIDYLADA